MMFRVKLSIQVDAEDFARPRLRCLLRNRLAFTIFAKVRFDQIFPLADTFLARHVLFQVKCEDSLDGSEVVHHR